jgi:competence protein ComEA
MADEAPQAPTAEQETVEQPAEDTPAYEEDEKIIADVPLELSPDGKVVEAGRGDVVPEIEDTAIKDLEEEGEVPEWLQDLAKDTPIETEDVGVPDWLQGLTEEPHPLSLSAEEDVVGQLSVDEDIETPSEIAPEGILSEGLEEGISDWDQERADTDQVRIQEEEISPVEVDETEGETLVEATLDEELDQVPEFELEDTDAAIAWLEGLAAKQGVGEEELTTLPDERSDVPPDWIQTDTPSESILEPSSEIELEPMDYIKISAEIQEDVSSEPEELIADIPVDEVVSPIEDETIPEAIEPEELIADIPVDEVVSPIEDETAPEAIEPDSIPVATAPEALISDEVEEIPGEETTEIMEDKSPDFELEDTDAALAWLEGLAVKRGVDEEELITQPKERSEIPPDWVQEVAVEDIEETPIDDAEVSIVDVEAETILDDETDPQVEAEEDEQIIGELDGVESMTEKAEQVLDEDLEDAPTVELEIEPPTWIAEFDLNSASMVQLERLPGIGFRRAQNIVAYREEHGPFQRYDELLNIPDIDNDILDIIKTQLTIKETGISGPEELRSPIPEPEDETHALQLEARGSLEKGDIDTGLEMYQELIKQGERLEGIIEDLRAATYQHPMSVSILQTLGDAYMHSDNLQEALDTYTKAEELLR